MISKQPENADERPKIVKTSSEQRRRQIEQIVRRRQSSIIKERQREAKEAREAELEQQKRKAEELDKLDLKVEGSKEAEIDKQKEFMGFPLAGGPNDDISSLLSRDLYQSHLEKQGGHRASVQKDDGQNFATDCSLQGSFLHHVFEQTETTTDERD